MSWKPNICQFNIDKRLEKRTFWEQMSVFTIYWMTELILSALIGEKPSGEEQSIDFLFT